MADKRRCLECNKELVLRQEKFCCLSHSASYNNRFFRAENARNWKGGRRKSSDGYIKIYCIDHPFAPKDLYIFEHRLVMEEDLGRYLDPTEVVHHVNGNKTDNRIENLMLFSSQAEHCFMHNFFQSEGGYDSCFAN